MDLHPSTNTVDSSKLQTFLDCPRQYWYRYVMGWDLDRPNQHLIFGTCWHSALDVLWTCGMSKDALFAAKATFEHEYRATFDDLTDDLYHPKTPAMAFECLDLYHQRMLRDAEKYETLHTEVSGTVSIGDEANLTFRIDHICRDRKTGRVMIREFKTSGRKDRMWTDKWLLSTQIGTYSHVLYSMFPEVEVIGVQVEGAIFQKRGCDVFILPCPRTKEQMLSWLSDTKCWVAFLQSNLDYIRQRDLEELRQRDVMCEFPRNTQSCTKYLGCQYHDFCVAWSNPWRRSERPPVGFKEEWWDPHERPTNKVVTL